MTTSAERRLVTILAAVLITIGAGVGAAVAQEQASGPAVIHSGNTDIVFESAGTNGIPTDRYQAFDRFATEHPEDVRALTHNPRLIKNERFINNHAALADFLRAHPDVASDFAENPGNYVDMPVAIAASIKRNPIESQ